MPIEWTRRELLRAGASIAASATLGCSRGEAAPQRLAQPLRLSYGGFAMGMQSYTLRSLPLEAALDAVRDLGLSHVELIPETKLAFYTFGTHFPVSEDAAASDRVLALCAARGLAIAAHGVNAVPNPEAARRLFAFAERARIPVLTIMPAESTLAELDALCAARPGVKLAIHNHGPKLPWETIEEIEAALANRHPGFGACVDTGHFIRSGIDPVEAIRRFGARVHGVHLKDFAGEGFFTEGAILGRGKLDLPAVFRALRDVQFSGALSLEYEEHPDDVLPDVVECLRAASDAAERVARG